MIVGFPFTKFGQNNSSVLLQTLKIPTPPVLALIVVPSGGLCGQRPGKGDDAGPETLAQHTEWRRWVRGPVCAAEMLRHNRIIGAKDHASIQTNVAEVDKVTGRFNGQFKTYAICGAVRRMGGSDDSIFRLAKADGIISKNFWQEDPGHGIFVINK